MIKKYSGLLLIVLFILQGTLAAQSITPYFKGYLKELGSFSLSNDLNTVHYDNIIHNRLESRFSFESGFEIKADLRTRLINGFTVENVPGYADILDNDPGFVDMSLILVDKDKAIVHTAIDRLQLSYYSEKWDVVLGRQRVNWGKSMVWNPNDLFNAYSYLDFDYEERPGTDALTVQYSWSYASSLQLGYKFGKSLDESVIAFMARGNVGDYDFQLITGNYLDKLVLGAGWTGYLHNAGFNGEISYFRSRENFIDESGHIAATVGSDYMFSNSLYLSGELLYNGGWNSNSNALAQLSQPPTADNLFISETGFFVNSNYPLTALTNLSFGVMGSFTESVFVFIPQVSYSVTENLDFLVLSQLLKGNALQNATNTPNVLFFRLKWSF